MSTGKIENIKLVTTDSKGISNSYNNDNRSFIKDLADLLEEKRTYINENNYELCAKVRSEEWNLLQRAFNLDKWKMFGEKSSSTINGVMIYSITK